MLKQVQTQAPGRLRPPPSCVGPGAGRGGHSGRRRKGDSWTVRTTRGEGEGRRRRGQGAGAGSSRQRRGGGQSWAGDAKDRGFSCPGFLTRERLRQRHPLRGIAEGPVPGGPRRAAGLDRSAARSLHFSQDTRPPAQPTPLAVTSSRRHRRNAPEQCTRQSGDAAPSS